MQGSAASQSARERRASQPPRRMVIFMLCVCSRLIPSRRHGRCHSRLGTDRLRRSGLVCELEDGRDPRPRSNCRAGRGRSPCSRSTARNSSAGGECVDAKRCPASRSRQAATGRRGGGRCGTLHCAGGCGRCRTTHGLCSSCCCCRRGCATDAQRRAASLCDATGCTAACSAHPHTGPGPERRSCDDPWCAA